MTDRALTVPAASETVEQTLAMHTQWFKGYVDAEGKQQPGLLLMVGEMYAAHKLKQERQEAVGRAIAAGSILSAFGLLLGWLFHGR